MFKKIRSWYGKQNDTARGLIWAGIICLVGILLRWNEVVAGIVKGFRFYSGG